MKRILIFSLSYHPFVGGAEVAVKEITDRVGSEYAFDMITLRFDRNLPEMEKIGAVTIHRIGPSVRGAKVSDRRLPLMLRLAKILFPFTAYAKALSLHKQHPYDMVWAIMANQAGFAALFFKYTHPEVPYVLELQDGRALGDMKRRQPILALLWYLYRRVYLKADRIKAISHFIEKEVRMLGYGKEIVVIPNAVDVAHFSHVISEEDLAETKARLGKKMGDIFLFTASRLVLSRGVEDTIRALTHLPTNVKLLIAGDGDDREKLKAIAQEAKVQGRVIFAGQVAHKDLPAYYRVSDIFVRPSVIEGFGNAFVEAFAAGIPVVATSVGGIPDFLSDPDVNPDMEPTGIFCEVHNPESVARAVQRYINDPVLTERIRKNALSLAAERYDWSLIAEQMKTRIFDR